MCEDNTLKEIKWQVEKLILAPSVCEEAKKCAEEWLKSLGTPNQKAQSKKLVKELEEDIEPIDALIEFCKSKRCEELFSKPGAEKILSHSQEIKSQGAKFCDCPACVSAQKILNYKEYLLK